MANDTPTFTEEESGATIRAVLIPARVQYFLAKKGDPIGQAVGTLEASQLQDPKTQSKDLFGEEILYAGAAPWARKTAKELLGVKEPTAV
jgi:hypothetical protein